LHRGLGDWEIFGKFLEILEFGRRKNMEKGCAKKFTYLHTPDVDVGKLRKYSNTKNKEYG
jgi:hypothetical protein